MTDPLTAHATDALARLRQQGCTRICPACEMAWKGDAPCWSCGRPGTSIGVVLSSRYDAAIKARRGALEQLAVNYRSRTT